IGAGAGDGEKVAAVARQLRGFASDGRNGDAERDAAHDAAGNQARGVRDVPGDAEFLGEDVGGAGGEQCHGNVAAGEAVDDFVDRAIAAADHDHAAALLDGLARDQVRGGAGGGGGDLRGNAGVL